MPRARKKSNGNGNGTAPLQPMSKKMMKRKITKKKRKIQSQCKILS